MQNFICLGLKFINKNLAGTGAKKANFSALLFIYSYLSLSFVQLLVIWALKDVSDGGKREKAEKEKKNIEKKNQKEERKEEEEIYNKIEI